MQELSTCKAHHGQLPWFAATPGEDQKSEPSRCKRQPPEDGGEGGGGGGAKDELNNQ